MLTVYFPVWIRVPSPNRKNFPNSNCWVSVDLQAELLSRVAQTVGAASEQKHSITAVLGSREFGLADVSDNHHDLLLREYSALFVHLSPAPHLQPVFKHYKATLWFSSARVPLKLLSKARTGAANPTAPTLMRLPYALQLNSMLFVGPKPHSLLQQVASQRPSVAASLQSVLAAPNAAA